MPGNRKTELSAASLVLMTLVVFIHSAAECVTGYDPASLPFLLAASAHRVASFAVQGFLFLAGLKLTLRMADDFSYTRYARGRLIRIGLPYLIAFSAFFAVYALTGRLSDPSPASFLIPFFTGGLTGHFYFVAVMAQFCLLVPLWRALQKKAHPALLLFVSLMLTLVFMDHMPELGRLATGFRVELTRNAALFTTYLFYWTAGMAAGSRYPDFAAFLDKQKRPLTVLWLLAVVVDCALLIAIRRGTYYALWSDDFHLLTCTLAILSLLAHARTLPASAVSALAPADRASYLIYLWHPMTILALDSAMNRLGIHALGIHALGIRSLALRFLLRFPLTLLLTAALCILWQALTSRLFHPSPKN